MSNRPKSVLEISWTTIRYRSVILALLLVLAAAGFAFYILLPAQAKAVAEYMSEAASSIGEKLGLLTPSSPKKTANAGPQQAHFTAIDGNVKIKKVSGSTFIAADYNLPLERGDVVQTSSDGMAKIVFTDGTSYTVKQDSLIVIDDNSINSNMQTQVSVQVTTGTVDLSTATFAAGSRSQVVVAGATASLSPESAAQVRNDPRADQHEILVSKGAGEVARGGQTVRLTEFEKVSFKADSKTMAKTKELGPPTLIGPGNMAPIFASGKSSPVQFSWTPVDNAAQYRIRVSRNPYFSSTVVDEKVVTPQIAAQLVEGAYYWMVQSLDASGTPSIESEKNRFTIIPRGQQRVALALELNQFVQHGHVIEIRGKTEVQAKVMVNGQEVPAINGDGTFTFLTPPLPAGENVITITAQNAKGGVNTQQRKVVIQ